MTGGTPLRRREPSWMLDHRNRPSGGMRMVRLAIFSAGLLVLLAGCMPIGGVRAEDPDATFDFDAGWKEVTPCARDQLSATFAGAEVLRTADFSEITVIGNYGGSTIMIIDIKDVTPGKARAATLTPAQRSDIARVAAQARWKKAPE